MGYVWFSGSSYLLRVYIFAPCILASILELHLVRDYGDLNGNKFISFQEQFVGIGSEAAEGKLTYVDDKLRNLQVRQWGILL